MKKIDYTEATKEVEAALDSAMLIDDFLPTPDKLVRKTEKEKITIAIDKHNLDLYKRYAKEHDASYQSMINGVLGAYANKFLKQP